MKIKAIQEVWVGDRKYLAGDIVTGLKGEDLKEAKADDKVVEVKTKKVKDGRKNS